MGAFSGTLRTVFVNTIADFFYFPIWWYTRGLLKQFKGVTGSFLSRKHDLAIDVWLKNIGTPMYGQYDFAGRVISFFMRLAQIIGRTFVLAVWAVLLLLWLLVWVAIPLIVVYFFVSQLTNFI